MLIAAAYTPFNHLSYIIGVRAAEAGFALVSAASGIQRRSRSCSSAVTSLLNTHAFHVRDLGQHGYNELTNAATDRAEAADMLECRLGG